jgi:hypothetical protein
MAAAKKKPAKKKSAKGKSDWVPPWKKDDAKDTDSKSCAKKTSKKK